MWRRAKPSRADKKATEALLAKKNADKLTQSEEKAKKEALLAMRIAETLAENEAKAKLEAIKAKAEALQRAEGESKARKAEEALRKRVERLLYAGQLKLVMRYWKAGEITAAYEALTQTNPAYRGWEYRHIDTLFHRLGRVTLVEDTERDVLCVAVSPDGRRLACARGNYAHRPKRNSVYVEVWDIPSGKQILTLKKHRDYVACIAFSPDGTRLVSGSRDATVKIWNLKTAKCLRTLKGHRDCIHSVAYSFDGRRVASAGFDKTIRIWNAKIGENCCVL